MGTFLCQISERDWLLSRELGIYGNKEGNVNDNTGKYYIFRDNIKYSIIRDLVGMKKGDNVVFHVVKKQSKISSIHGFYTVTKAPFYDRTPVWSDQDEIFPYRFTFEPHKEFKQICRFDSFIEVFDFYELIDNRKIWTLATLENERNIEARSVRKIEDSTEVFELIKYLYRDFNRNKNNREIDFKPILISKNVKSLENYIEGIGRFENSIKALLMYKLSMNLIPEYPQNCDFMNEVFIAQTARKSIDILCFQNINSNSRNYIISEVKTDVCDIKSLKQLLTYIDLFKQKTLFNLDRDTISGFLIGKSFRRDVIKYVNQKNSLSANKIVTLLQYLPNAAGTDAKFKVIE